MGVLSFQLTLLPDAGLGIVRTWTGYNWVQTWVVLGPMAFSICIGGQPLKIRGLHVKNLDLWILLKSSWIQQHWALIPTVVWSCSTTVVVDRA